MFLIVAQEGKDIGNFKRNGGSQEFQVEVFQAVDVVCTKDDMCELAR